MPNSDEKITDSTTRLSIYHLIKKIKKQFTPTPRYAIGGRGSDLVNETLASVGITQQRNPVKAQEIFLITEKDKYREIE